MIAWVRYKNGDFSSGTCNSVCSEGLFLVVFTLFDCVRNIFRASDFVVTQNYLASLLIVNYSRDKKLNRKTGSSGITE